MGGRLWALGRAVYTTRIRKETRYQLPERLNASLTSRPVFTRQSEEKKFMGVTCKRGTYDRRNAHRFYGLGCSRLKSAIGDVMSMKGRTVTRSVNVLCRKQGRRKKKGSCLVPTPPCNITIFR